MIAFLRGRVLRRLEQMLVVECGGVGYEVHLPEFVRDGLRGAAQGVGDTVELLSRIGNIAQRRRQVPLQERECLGRVRQGIVGVGAHCGTVNVTRQRPESAGSIRQAASAIR